MTEHYCANCKYAEQSNIGLLCMGQKGMPLVPPKSKCDSWKSAKQTNADRIRSMTDEELAEFINDVFYTLAVKPGMCDVCDNDGVNNCRECWLDWLKQEVSE